MGAPFSSAAGHESGAAYLVLGPVGGPGSLGDAYAILEGPGADHGAGRGVAFGDLDGDGRDELLVGTNTAEFDSGPGRNDGVYVVDGPPPGTFGLDVVADAVWTGIPDHSDSTKVGVIHDSPGDLNGDGLADLVIGDLDYSESYDSVGIVFVVYGPATAGGSLSTADVRIFGDAPNLLLGQSIMDLGDVTGDGRPELAVASHGGNDDYDGERGQVFVFEDLPGDALFHTDADTVFRSNGSSSPIAVSPRSSVGLDFDGDGHRDAAFGAYMSHGDPHANVGEVFVVHGPFADEERMLTAELHIWGTVEREAAGTSVDSAGDLDGDGADDLVVGSRAHTRYGYDTGAVFVFYGPVSGTIDTEDAPVRLWGEPGWAAGWALEASADPTGDGLTDLVIGIPWTAAGGIVVVPGGGL